MHARTVERLYAPVTPRVACTELECVISWVQCASFYSIRGRSHPQRCGGTHMVLTLIEPDIPSELCQDMNVMPW